MSWMIFQAIEQLIVKNIHSHLYVWNNSQNRKLPHNPLFANSSLQWRPMESVSFREQTDLYIREAVSSITD